MTLILRDVATKARAIDPARRYAEFVASTERVDSHDSIVRQSWRLERYASNPIVLRDHNTGRVIGKGDFRIEGKESVIGITFAKGTVDADETWALVEQDMLRAVSVGFIPGKVSIEEIDGRDILVYEDNELYENSVVAIPSNPEALAREYRASDEAESGIRRALIAERDAARTPKENTPMSEPTKPAPAAEATTVAAPEVRAPETVNKEAMDLVVKTLQGQITERDAALVTLKAETEKLRADLAETRKAGLETKVRSFVGSKLTEATLPKFLDLAKKSEEAFDVAIEALPDLGIAPGVQVVPDAKAQARGAGGEDAKVDWITKRAAEIRKDEPGLSKAAAFSRANHEAQARGLLGERHDHQRNVRQRAIRRSEPLEDRWLGNRRRQRSHLRS